MNTLTDEQLAEVTVGVNRRLQEFGERIFDEVPLGIVRVVMDVAARLEEERARTGGDRKETLQVHFSGLNELKIAAERLSEHLSQRIPDMIQERLAATPVIVAYRTVDVGNLNGHVSLTEPNPVAALEVTPPAPTQWFGTALDPEHTAEYDQEWEEIPDDGPEDDGPADDEQPATDVAETGSPLGAVVPPNVDEKFTKSLEEFREEYAAAIGELAQNVKATLGPEHTVVTPLRDTPAPDKPVGRERVTADAQRRAEELAQIVAALKTLAADGEMPTIQTWDARKPAHLPTWSGITKAHGLSWADLAYKAKLTYNRRGKDAARLQARKATSLEPVSLDQFKAAIVGMAMGRVMPSQEQFNESKPAVWPSASALVVRFRTSWEELAQELKLDYSRGRKHVRRAA